MNNKQLILFSIMSLFLISCSPAVDKSKMKAEVLQTEKAFEKLAADSGIAYAFNSYAADSAVIKRENDSVIVGKAGIFHYYSNNGSDSASVKWTADFVDVSDDGTMAYTYGKYIIKVLNADNTTQQFSGTFHTVWKKQTDGKWKFVWD